MAPHGGTSLVAIAALLGHDIHVLGARARLHQDTAQAAEQPGLRVHAATFNAGNQRFKREDRRFEELLAELSRGHEDSDLVILGLQEFGDKDYGFAGLAKRTLWRGPSERRLGELNREILGIAAAPEEVVSQKATLKSYLQEKHAALNATLLSIDIDGIKQMMEPMKEWTKSALDGIDDVWPRFPNLQYTDEGTTDINRFLHELDRVEHTQKQVAARIQLLRALGGGDIADSLHMLDWPQGADPQEMHARNRKVMLEWSKLTEVLDELHAEMTWWEGGERSPWSADIVADVDDLLPEPELSFEVDDMDVMFEPVTFDSGLRCSAGSHYDTVLYTFVNPWSEWKIVPEPYSSGTCKHFEEDYERTSGCSIDNNARMECGKVVNLLRFKATRADATLRYCALNTHMSFSGTAEERLRILEAAMDETKAAKCDSVIFVGDFNTRLHCQRGMADDLPLPPYERASGSGSSLDYVLDSFERGGDGGYALAGSGSQHFDELSQMLANSTVDCYESHKESDGWFGSKTVWTVNTTQSRLPNMGLFEAPVNFGPSYKLGTASKASKAKSHRCVKDMKFCYVNPSGKGKHNPAWTDRVLVQADPQVAQVEVLAYARHEAPEDFGSDHLPVVGRVAVYPVTQ